VAAVLVEQPLKVATVLTACFPLLLQPVVAAAVSLKAHQVGRPTLMLLVVLAVRAAAVQVPTQRLAHLLAVLLHLPVKVTPEELEGIQAFPLLSKTVVVVAVQVPQVAMLQLPLAVTVETVWNRQ
jgi:hypothetical protein